MRSVWNGWAGLPDYFSHVVIPASLVSDHQQQGLLGAGTQHLGYGSRDMALRVWEREHNT